MKHCPACSKDLVKSSKLKKFICKNKNCKKEFTDAEIKSFENQQRIQVLIDRKLQDLIYAEQFLTSSPNRSFQIGEFVDTNANWDNPKVIDIKQQRFYLIEYLQRDGSKSHCWVRWDQIYKKDRKVSENLMNQRSKNVYNQISIFNIQIDGLLNRYYHFGIEMNPSYQRGFVWSMDDKTKLIESIFLGLDIGKFVLIERPYKDNDPSYEILDGKQRLKAIVDFVEDRYPYNGYFYSELQNADKSYFHSFVVALGSTNATLTDEDKIKYFLAVNNTGVPQNLQHLEYLKKQLNTKKEK